LSPQPHQSDFYQADASIRLELKRPPTKEAERCFRSRSPLAFESLGARSSALSAEEEAGVSVGFAAEFLDVKPSLLEARRKELFGKAEI
jgi:hypothetical protein